MPPEAPGTTQHQPMQPPPPESGFVTGAYRPGPGSTNQAGPLLGPRKPQHAGLKTLVLDLDETLSFSSLGEMPHADYVIPLVHQGATRNVYVRRRPHVINFIKAMSCYFELVVFTAGEPDLANRILDFLDPCNLISYRLFREHCTW